MSHESAELLALRAEIAALRAEVAAMRSELASKQPMMFPVPMPLHPSPDMTPCDPVPTSPPCTPPGWPVYWTTHVEDMPAWIQRG